MAKKTAPSLASLQQEIEALKADIKRLNAKLALSNSDFLNIVSKSLHGVVILDQKKWSFTVIMWPFVYSIAILPIY